MSDNVQADKPQFPNGPKFRTDIDSGIHTPVQKIQLGIEDEFDGFVAATNPMPVTTQFNRGIQDAFGRVRVSDPVTLFDSQSEYDAGTLLWENDLTGSGTATHVANESAVDLATTTASGDKVIRQTRQYHRYQPGKSQFILCTFRLSDAQTGLEQRVGYFDGSNGIYLELDDNTLNVVLRSNVSGAPVNTKIAQADWNVDVMNDLDITKAQIFFVGIEWLGVGQVSCGFVIDGAFRYCHQFNNANNVTTTYMTTANLPVRYEIENTAGIGSAATLKAICCTVISEGGFESERGYPFSASNGITPISVTTRRAVLSIRPKATFNSITNRGTINLSGVNAYAQTNTAFIEVVYDATLGGSPSFTSADANSIVEYDVAGTTITGGQVLSSFFVPAAGTGVNTRPSSAEIGLLSRLPLTLDISGANPKTISLVATSFSGTSEVSTSFSWTEVR